MYLPWSVNGYIILVVKVQDIRGAVAYDFVKVIEEN